ncbi:MAG: peptidase [Chloroflexi bacterium]|nr:peptidase [Chloroflexota bacterium]MDA1146056.1 peptidase [Chloroflexota bacterium]
MTFCLGMKCEDGLLAIADTRITSGTEASMAKKITVHQGDHHSMFILTSGLRSIRDKAITYFEERLDREESGQTKMYEAVNALAAEIRRVREEDSRWLIEGGLSFDLHCIIGGQLEADSEPHLYLLYPEGNWIEVRTGTPYVIIGESRYGKPILDRVWSHDQPLSNALRNGILAFDATVTSASDVDPPLDTVLYLNNSYQMREHRFHADALLPIRKFWSESVRKAVDAIGPLIDPLIEQLEAAPPAPDRITSIRPR